MGTINMQGSHTKSTISEHPISSPSASGCYLRNTEKNLEMVEMLEMTYDSFEACSQEGPFLAYGVKNLPQL